MESKSCRYRVGIDVGLYSVGLAAVEIDDSSDNPLEAMPIDFLSIMSVIHDGAIDPSAQKSADSRKAVSGVARRTRRLSEQRRKRYEKLDELLEECGYPAAQAASMVSDMHDADPYLPWRARIESVDDFIKDEKQRKLSVSVALRHIARHRGWRNPYSSVCSLEDLAPKASAFYLEYFEKIQRWLYQYDSKSMYKGVTGKKNDDGAIDIIGMPSWEIDKYGQMRPTIAQLVEPLLLPKHSHRIRGVSNNAEEVLSASLGKMHQSDIFYELKKIFDTQRIPEKDQRAFFDVIFWQINPKETGASAELTASDDLQPGRPRASKSSLAFQRYRILATIANLKIKQKGKQSRVLTSKERSDLFDYLTSETASFQGDELSWHDVASAIGIDRKELAGVGGQTVDGMPISSKQPPFLNTDAAIRTLCKKTPELKSLSDWWNKASLLSKEYLIELLGNTGSSDVCSDEAECVAKGEAEALLSDLGGLGADALRAIESVHLAAGRSSYSINTLERINCRMLADGVDLLEARKLEFGVENDWRPKPSPLGSATGNPAVDRTIKIVARWLRACERVWGKPETVSIEHVRDGFRTEKQKRTEQAGMDKRFRANNLVRAEIIEALDDRLGSGVAGKEVIRHSDIRRWQAIQRQNGCCLYCGKNINFENSQMDHIVPRKGVGSSNELSNLVAVCADCNTSKSNIPFYAWTGEQKYNEAVERVMHWNRDSYFSSDRQFRTFKKDVIARLGKVEKDEPLDVRSIESVAWMARELKNQVEGYFGYLGTASQLSGVNKPYTLQRVQVFKGWVTSEARKASGLEKALPWIGGGSRKARIDRRHHAIDAAVIALMRPGVAKVLLERDALHRELVDSGIQNVGLAAKDWRSYKGSKQEETRLYCHWRDKQMLRLRDILTKSMENDSIVVSEQLRLRLGVGRAHQDKIHPMFKKKVGDMLSAAAIDKAESPALWTALTNHPDYDAETGLPEDWKRRIRVHGRWYDAEDCIGFMAASQNDLDRLNINGAAYIRVRYGYAAVGDTIHHVRIYRIPKLNSRGVQNGWQYASLRVFQTDLLKHQYEDLFSVPLALGSTSVRTSIPLLRDALSAGSAEYLGWIVAGDELLVDRESPLFCPDGSQKMNKFMKAFPNINRFRIIGFGTNSKITLTPTLLSSEGIPDIDWASAKARDIVSRVYGCHDWTQADVDAINFVIEKGCPLSFDKVCSTQPVVIRRNALGEVRWKTNNNMPLSWHVPKHPENGAY